MRTICTAGKEIGVQDLKAERCNVFDLPSCSGGFPALPLDGAPSEKSPQPLLLLPAACEMAAHLYHHLERLYLRGGGGRRVGYL